MCTCEESWPWCRRQSGCPSSLGHTLPARTTVSHTCSVTCSVTRARLSRPTSIPTPTILNQYEWNTSALSSQYSHPTLFSSSFVPQHPFARITPSVTSRGTEAAFRWRSLPRRNAATNSHRGSRCVHVLKILTRLETCQAQPNHFHSVRINHMRSPELNPCSDRPGRPRSEEKCWIWRSANSGGNS